jgi:DNA modification methylase
MTVDIIEGDALTELRLLPDESVHCVVTSPPYFGLRDYGVAGQIGLEPTPAEFVAVMVEVFREVRRVLRKDGTLWLNLGDSYARQGGTQGGGNRELLHLEGKQRRMGALVSGLKEKDLIGIPWRVAFALQADGWYLRQDIIWSKPNPMPESVTDRCTKAHEYLFLLSKSARYHYDAEAIKEPAVADHPSGNGYKRDARKTYQNGDGSPRGNDEQWKGVDGTRNRRSVWTVTTKPFKEAHFATFPPDLIEPCIKAGCPRDCCAKCGAPLLRQTSRGVDAKQVNGSSLDRFGTGDAGVHRKVGGQYQKWLDENPKITTGWLPSCSCDADLVRGTVLDPFAGAGTTGMVADRLQRDAILIELNPKYADMAERRIIADKARRATVVDAAIRPGAG